MMNDYANQFSLILEACRTEPDPERIEHCLQSIGNWNHLLNIAYMHGVLPLVYKTLKSQPAAIPSKALEYFKMRNFEIAQTNLQMSSELLRIVNVFNENGIAYIALKGPVLSQIIHGDTLQRQYTDLDLLVAQKDIYKAALLLQENDYLPEHSIDFLKNRTFLNIGQDLTFKNKQHGVFIELHWQLFLNLQVRKSQITLFSAQQMSSDILGQKIDTLEFEHLLIYLCIHGSKHFWERLEWVVDIDRLVRERQGIDWSKIANLVNAMQVEIMFYLGLSVAHGLFQTKLPDHIMEKIAQTPRIEKLRRNITDLIFDHDITQDTEQVDKFKIKHLLTLMADKKSKNLHNYFLWLFQIKKDDILTVNLPAYLFFLYYFIRIYRLLEYRYQSIKTRKSLGLKYIYLYIKAGINGK